MLGMERWDKSASSFGIVAATVLRHSAPETCRSLSDFGNPLGGGRGYDLLGQSGCLEGLPGAGRFLHAEYHRGRSTLQGGHWRGLLQTTRWGDLLQAGRLSGRSRVGCFRNVLIATSSMDNLLTLSSSLEGESSTRRPRGLPHAG